MFKQRGNKVLTDRTVSVMVLVNILLELTSPLMEMMRPPPLMIAGTAAGAERGEDGREPAETQERAVTVRKALRYVQGEVMHWLGDKGARCREAAMVMGAVVAWHPANAQHQAWAEGVVDRLLLQGGRLGLNTAHAVMEASAKCSEVFLHDQTMIDAIESRATALVTRGCNGRMLLSNFWRFRDRRLDFALMTPRSRQWIRFATACASAAIPESEAERRRAAPSAVARRRRFDADAVLAVATGGPAVGTGLDESLADPQEERAALIEVFVRELKRSSPGVLSTGEPTASSSSTANSGCCSNVCVPAAVLHATASFSLNEGTAMRRLLEEAVDEEHMVRGCPCRRPTPASTVAAHQGGFSAASLDEDRPLLSIVTKRAAARHGAALMMLTPGVPLDAASRAILQEHARPVQNLLNVASPFFGAAAKLVGAGDESNLAHRRAVRALATLTAFPYLWEPAASTRKALMTALRTNPTVWTGVVRDVPRIGSGILGMTEDGIRSMLFRLLEAASAVGGFHASGDVMLGRLCTLAARDARGVHDSAAAPWMWATAVVLSLLTAPDMTWGDAVRWLLRIVTHQWRMWASLQGCRVPYWKTFQDDLIMDSVVDVFP